jgi:hypothetical protein
MSSWKFKIKNNKNLKHSKEMKNLFISALVIVLTLVSCTNEESQKEDSIKIVSIIGKWHTVAAETNGKKMELSDCDLYGYLEFSENNKCVIEQGNFSDNKCNHYTSYANYTFENGILTYKLGIYESKSKITDLTDSGFKSTTFYIKDEYGTENISQSEQTTFTVEKTK